MTLKDRIEELTSDIKHYRSRIDSLTNELSRIERKLFSAEGNLEIAQYNIEKEE